MRIGSRKMSLVFLIMGGCAFLLANRRNEKRSLLDKAVKSAESNPEINTVVCDPSSFGDDSLSPGEYPLRQVVEFSEKSDSWKIVWIQASEDSAEAVYMAYRDSYLHDPVIHETENGMLVNTSDLYGEWCRDLLLRKKDLVICGYYYADGQEAALDFLADNGFIAVKGGRNG